LREDKNEELLISLVESGKLTTSTQNKEHVDPFLLAIDCEFSLSTLKKLLDKGFDINTQDESGRTPLHYAIDLDNMELLKFLIENGAEPEI
jgi:ankyrin repeat protein